MPYFIVIDQTISEIWPFIRHLVFVVRVPTQFGWNRWSFDNMLVLMLCEFRLKRIFTPILVYFGRFRRKPYRPTHWHTSYSVNIGPQARPVRVTKKPEKEKNKSYSGKWGVCRDHPRRRIEIKFCLWESSEDSTVLFTVHLHCVPKKEDTKLMAVTLSFLNRFSKFFHWHTQR